MHPARKTGGEPDLPPRGRGRVLAQDVVPGCGTAGNAAHAAVARVRAGAHVEAQRGRGLQTQLRRGGRRARSRSPGSLRRSLSGAHLHLVGRALRQTAQGRAHVRPDVRMRQPGMGIRLAILHVVARRRGPVGRRLPGDAQGARAVGDRRQAAHRLQDRHRHLAGAAVRPDGGARHPPRHRRAEPDLPPGRHGRVLAHDGVPGRRAAREAADLGLARVRARTHAQPGRERGLQAGLRRRGRRALACRPGPVPRRIRGSHAHVVGRAGDEAGQGGFGARPRMRLRRPGVRALPPVLHGIARGLSRAGRRLPGHAHGGGAGDRRGQVAHRRRRDAHGRHAADFAVGLHMGRADPAGQRVAELDAPPGRDRRVLAHDLVLGRGPARDRAYAAMARARAGAHVEAQRDGGLQTCLRRPHDGRGTGMAGGLHVGRAHPTPAAVAQAQQPPGGAGRELAPNLRPVGTVSVQRGHHPLRFLGARPYAHVLGRPVLDPRQGPPRDGYVVPIALGRHRVLAHPAGAVGREADLPPRAVEGLADERVALLGRQGDPVQRGSVRPGPHREGGRRLDLGRLHPVVHRIRPNPACDRARVDRIHQVSARERNLEPDLLLVMVAGPAGHGAPRPGPRRFAQQAENVVVVISNLPADFRGTAHIDGGRSGLHFNAVGTVLHRLMRHQGGMTGMGYRHPFFVLDVYGRVPDPAYPDVRHRNLPPGGRRRILAQDGVEDDVVVGIESRQIRRHQARGLAVGLQMHSEGRCRRKPLRYGAGRRVPCHRSIHREKPVEIDCAQNDAPRALLRLGRIVFIAVQQQSVRIAGRERRQAEGAEMHMQVRIRTAARVAGQTQQLALRHLLARVYVDLRQMGVRMLEAGALGPRPDAHVVAVDLV